VKATMAELRAHSADVSIPAAARLLCSMTAGEACLTCVWGQVGCPGTAVLLGCCLPGKAAADQTITARAATGSAMRGWVPPGKLSSCWIDNTRMSTPGLEFPHCPVWRSRAKRANRRMVEPSS
jgi:hypothetical protein